MSAIKPGDDQCDNYANNTSLQLFRMGKMGWRNKSTQRTRDLIRGISRFLKLSEKQYSFPEMTSIEDCRQSYFSNIESFFIRHLLTKLKPAF